MSLLSNINTIHVEVCLKQTQHRQDYLAKMLEPALRDYIKQQASLCFNVVQIIGGADVSETDLQYIESILLERDSSTIPKKDSNEVTPKYQFHFYVPQRHKMELEILGNGDSSANGGDEESLPSSKHWLLPSEAFVGLWENLIYETGLKEQLLKFALSALSLSQHKVKTNIIACNRLVMLHGPPGTGKTSLCKALAQKLAIRARSCYRHTHLIEINSHSLFSKWFSESGKLVMRLFAKIHEIIADEQNLVCVLIDEVESLAYARSAMSVGQEPQDAMRVVNALLTQLDGIKEQSNVLILATSNLADTIDLAFLDRADIKQFIGLPSVPAIQLIYESMISELMRVGIIQQETLSLENSEEGLLTALAERSQGLSGRTLRKLPFLAHAMFTNGNYFAEGEKISLSDFLDSMLMALEKHLQDQQQMAQKTNI